MLGACSIKLKCHGPEAFANRTKKPSEQDQAPEQTPRAEHPEQEQGPARTESWTYRAVPRRVLTSTQEKFTSQID